MSTDEPDGFLRVNAVLARTGLGRTTLYRMVREGSFPKQVQLTKRCTGWRESAVRDWVANPRDFRVPSQRTT